MAHEIRPGTLPSKKLAHAGKAWKIREPAMPPRTTSTIR
jgi:hypothetical protein